ncbi:hypothetical protein DYB25_010467 [Aphanomyces astaci]|uniref:Membrane insertase YidC/Oxa/ALB C-terminal domain-containing protein n=1 Tax=Aphanomyces astaci TaxID=112090 RepID=A0A397AGH6_APHAT|nr:hypothetical protein DYB25_010467 [Aphanomyces astaci]RHY19643.1 hypothetical protein DYB36_010666 [Aphanomyces astaci]
MGILQPKLQKLQDEIKSSPDAYDPAKMTEFRARAQALFKEHKVRPFMSFLMPISQLPIFLGFFWGLQDIAKYIPGYAADGAFWFENLAAPDPTYALPVLSSALMVASLEVCIFVCKLLIFDECCLASSTKRCVQDFAEQEPNRMATTSITSAKLPLEEPPPNTTSEVLQQISLPLDIRPRDNATSGGIKLLRPKSSHPSPSRRQSDSPLVKHPMRLVAAKLMASLHETSNQTQYSVVSDTMTLAAVHIQRMARGKLAGKRIRLARIVALMKMSKEMFRHKLQVCLVVRCY